MESRVRPLEELKPEIPAACRPRQPLRVGQAGGPRRKWWDGSNPPKTTTGQRFGAGWGSATRRWGTGRSRTASPAASRSFSPTTTTALAAIRWPRPRGRRPATRPSLRNFLKAAPVYGSPGGAGGDPLRGEIGDLLPCRSRTTRTGLPVVLHWGGVDGWKEDRRRPSEALHQMGLATMTIDMPGVGESPVLGSDPKAERTFSAALDYLETRADVDGSRLGVMGGSFGGYWGAKVAHVEAKRLKGAVDWGGGVHLTFQEEWLRPALTTRAEQYLMGPASLLDARGYIFRTRDLDEILKQAPRLSLVTQGLIDQPCAPAAAHQRQARRPASHRRLLPAAGARRPQGGLHLPGRRPHGPRTRQIQRARAERAGAVAAAQADGLGDASGRGDRPVAPTPRGH